MRRKIQLKPTKTMVAERKRLLAEYRQDINKLLEYGNPDDYAVLLKFMSLHHADDIVPIIVLDENGYMVAKGDL